VDLGETEPSVCSGRGLTVTACGNEASNVREEVIQTQEDDFRSALSLSTVTAADKVCYVCIIVLVTLVQVRTVESIFWECVGCVAN
jgi:hypothetical protein